MRLATGTFAAATLVLTLAWQPATAEDQTADFWQHLNDDMTNALLDDGDPEAIERLFVIGTEIGGIVEAPRFHRHYEDTIARIDIVFDPRREFTVDLFVMEFRDSIDVTIPAFRGHLTNCSEARPTDCTDLRLTSRADFTVGVAACLCERGAWRDQWRGQTMTMVPCWRGRGATYLDFFLVYDDPDGLIHDALRDGPGPGSASICAASDAAQEFPEFLAHRHVGAQSLPDGIDPNAWPLAVVAGTGELQHLREDYGFFGGN